MRQQIRRPLGIVVVSVLLVALAAGAALAAVVTCVPGATTCSGTTQDDHITGTNGVDRINAGYGNDEVYAQGGADYASGGPGQDQLIGDSEVDSLAGNDRIYGNSGDDVLTGEARSDYLDGGNHDDTIYAQGTYLEGKDTVFGGTGDDTIYAHDGIKDTIDCSDGFDEVDYDSGIDVVAANCERRTPHHSNAVTDFSSGENPRGVWTYGYKASDGSNFYPYTKHVDPYPGSLRRVFRVPRTLCRLQLHGPTSFVPHNQPSSGRAQPPSRPCRPKERGALDGAVLRHGNNTRQVPRDRYWGPG